MRLIDADAIEYKMLYKEDFLQGSGVEGQAARKADIDKMPTIDPVTHGKWIKMSNRNYRCSVCRSWWSVDRDSTINDFDFCPNCGAKMERSEDGET